MQRTDWLKFIPFSAQIPVELTSFAGNIVNGNVILNWVTATELNNSGFEIERSRHTERSRSRDENGKDMDL